MSYETIEPGRRIPVIGASQETRALFISRTYQHLLGAILGFVLIEVFLFKSGLAERIAVTMLSWSWLLILGAFMIVGWLASHVAHRSQSLPAQYAALVGFVLAEAIIFVPMLFIANHYAPGAIKSAAVVTMIGFACLTAIVFISRKDFSFLGSILRWGFIVALVLIVAGIVFGFNLGMLFSVAMVALAGGAILYDTSNVLHHFPEDRYVGAALELFASVALLFWYVLRLFMARD
jgi:FtsH-binding integral membrane protein